MKRQQSTGFWNITRLLKWTKSRTKLYIRTEKSVLSRLFNDLIKLVKRRRIKFVELNLKETEIAMDSRQIHSYVVSSSTVPYCNKTKPTCQKISWKDNNQLDFETSLKETEIASELRNKTLCTFINFRPCAHFAEKNSSKGSNLEETEITSDLYDEIKPS